MIPGRGLWISSSLAFALLLIMYLIVSDARASAPWIGGALALAAGGLVLGRRRIQRRLRRTLRQSRRAPVASGRPRAPWVTAPPIPGMIRAPSTLEVLRSLTPTQFEEFARLLMERIGYQQVRRVGGSSDRGIDLEMRDGAGNRCIVQCKRYKGTVPPHVVRELYGVMEHAGVREAYLLTTGRVSHDAQAWIGTRPLHVWDGERLVRYAQHYLGGDLAAIIKRAQQ